MLDATERKTLAWSAFIAGVLCVIPGEVPKGPRIVDYLWQAVPGRILDHHATQIAWGLAFLLVVYHLRRLKLEEAAENAQTAAPAPTPEPGG